MPQVGDFVKKRPRETFGHGMLALKNGKL